MRYFRHVSAVFAIALTVASCEQKEEFQTVALEPVLSSVQMQVNTVEIPVDGNVEVAFTVVDGKFAFNPASDVILSPQSEAFSLTQVRSTGEGRYVAVLSDTGKGEDYEYSVQLGVRKKAGEDSFVFSSSFTVRIHRLAPGVLIPETGLATVYIDTENNAPIVSKEEYVPAALTIRSDGGRYDLEQVNCSVRGRGNTTWEWPKKPYLIKLDKKAEVFGLPKHKRWILLANFMDRSLMRNLVAMKVSSMTNLDWTPHCEPVELVLNGRHRGTYVLIEQVRVDKNRVNVTEMTPEDNEGEAVTGGYLLECDFHYDNEVQWTDPHGGSVEWGSEGGIPFSVKYPDEEDLTEAQLAYIKQYVYDTAEAIYGPDFTDLEKGYANYIDVDSFVDYWLVFEVMGNHELGNPGSVFMHKDRGGKLVAGPCWDFDWGVLSYNTSPQGKTGLINGEAIWYARLFEDPVFKEKVKKRFQELLPQLETIPAYMDALQERLSESARYNFRMWDPAGDANMNGGFIINGDENLTFEEAVKRLKDNYDIRLGVLSEKL
ncbi:MAG: CotH kinase family protein [Bacteroidales bacterium]|nr:CotH kinase family protein [Bacteroidales bacterium]